MDAGARLKDEAAGRRTTCPYQPSRVPLKWRDLEWIDGGARLKDEDGGRKLW
jgi:hypothetical protein